MARYLSPKFRWWRTIIERQLVKLNEDFDLGKTEYFYEIGYRGKNHRMVLLRNEETYAVGMINISQVVMKLRGIHFLAEGVM